MVLGSEDVFETLRVNVLKNVTFIQIIEDLYVEQ